MNAKRVLYITYDGITDHIGQSQVAPYLIGLSRLGHKITLISAEKMEKEALISKYKKIFSDEGIEWHIITYSKRPPVLSSIKDIWKMRSLAGRLIRSNGIQIVHCRSYMASLIGLHFKRKSGVPFIFDMRDFWPDAGKETKRFDIENNFLHRQVYKFFKKKEREFLHEADYIVSLTEAGKKVIEEWGDTDKAIKAPVAVIPCCADFAFFDPQKIEAQRLEQWRTKLGIQPTDFIVSYLGSVGASYLTDKMFEVFKAFQQKVPAARFLFIANNGQESIRVIAANAGVAPEKVLVTSGSRDEVPYLISLSDVGLFFIMPSFAKKACSPTKLAEYFAMSKPVISNSQVGDLAEILSIKQNGSAAISAFNEDAYQEATGQVLAALKNGAADIRSYGNSNFSLERGTELYSNVYQSL